MQITGPGEAGSLEDAALAGRPNPIFSPCGSSGAIVQQTLGRSAPSRQLLLLVLGTVAHGASLEPWESPDPIPINVEMSPYSASYYPKATVTPQHHPALGHWQMPHVPHHTLVLLWVVGVCKETTLNCVFFLIYAFKKNCLGGNSGTKTN